MILSFTFQNFRSFADEAQLFLASDSMRTNVPRVGETWPELTQRTAAIYGANASGKTSVLQALWTLARAVRAPFGASLYQPHAQDAARVTQYSVDFVSDGIRYEYEVKAAPWGIEYEGLFSYPKGSRRRLFERTKDSPDSEMVLVKGPSLSGPTKQVEQITQDNTLFLGVARFLRHPMLEEASRGIAADEGVEYLSFAQLQDGRFLTEVVGKMLQSPQDQQKLVGSILEAGDLGLEAVEVRKEKVPTPVLEEVRRMLTALNNAYVEEGAELPDLPEMHEALVFHHRGVGSSKFTLGIDSESSGTKSWMVMAWNVVDVLRRGAVLLVDELDASLHPELARHVVELFQSSATNPKGAQLIFTTHDVSLLGNVPIRLLDSNDVWFTEKSDSGTSELYSMADFEGRRGNNNQRRYQSGQFGAIPRIDESLLLRYIEDDAMREQSVGTSET